MTLYDFLSSERDGEGAPPRILSAALLSGATNAGVLVIVAAAKRSLGQTRPGLWLAFAAICALYVYSYSYCVKAITDLTESALRSLRLRLNEKLRSAELLMLDSIGPGKIYDQITQQTTVISNTAWVLALGLQAASLLLFVLLYILFASQLVMITIVLLSAVAIPLYMRHNRQVITSTEEATATRVRLFGALNDFLQGFKEVRLRQVRGEDLQREYNAIAEAARDATVRAQVLEQESHSFISANFYLLLAFVVFVLPRLVTSDVGSLHDVTAAVLFLMGPIGVISFTLPQYERASLATESLQALEARLDHAGSTTTEATEAPAPTAHDAPRSSQGPQHIVLSDLSFAYQDPAGGAGFAIGPVSLEIHRGEILFFVGGNGSGKTTLLKTIAGLYIPSSGSISVDGVPITDDNRQAFRENFAAIFTDFHLFKKLYGLAQSSPQQVAQLLQKLQIAHKTAYGDNGFTRTNLSTGQRKRIAMVVALLEDRPLYIFDEWAADQDPEFRHYYYEQLLPDLKRRGKTVLAISHDDRYFHCADRVVTLDYGTVRSIDTFSPTAPQPESDQRRA